MCGIVYVKRNTFKASRMVWKKYVKQRDRGTRGFGFIEIGKTAKIKRATEETEIQKLLKKSQSKQILYHHRTPTSTPNYVEATHPMMIKTRKFKHNYYLVHNGIISNDDELKEKHNELGIEYRTEMEEQTVAKKTIYTHGIKFNDSESLAIDLSLYLEGKSEELDVEGSIAFIMLQTDKKGKPLNLFFGRNYQNPLKMKAEKDFFSLASEGQGEDVEAHILHCLNLKTNKITKKELTFASKRYLYNGRNDYNYGRGHDYGKKAPSSCVGSSHSCSFHSKDDSVSPSSSTNLLMKPKKIGNIEMITSDDTMDIYERMNDLTLQLNDLHEELVNAQLQKDYVLTEMLLADITEAREKLEYLATENLDYPVGF